MERQPVSGDLRQVANAFVELQDARLEADYDLGRTFSRREVRDLIETTENATKTWRKVRKTSEAQVFLTALLIGEKVSRL